MNRHPFLNRDCARILARRLSAELHDRDVVEVTWHPPMHSPTVERAIVRTTRPCLSILHRDRGFVEVLVHLTTGVRFQTVYEQVGGNYLPDLDLDVCPDLDIEDLRNTVVELVRERLHPTPPVDPNLGF
jgi:hypothetical protein